MLVYSLDFTACSAKLSSFSLADVCKISSEKILIFARNHIMYIYTTRNFHCLEIEWKLTQKLQNSANELTETNDQVQKKKRMLWVVDVQFLPKERRIFGNKKIISYQSRTNKGTAYQSYTPAYISNVKFDLIANFLSCTFSKRKLFTPAGTLLTGYLKFYLFQQRGLSLYLHRRRSSKVELRSAVPALANERAFFDIRFYLPSISMTM